LTNLTSAPPREAGTVAPTRTDAPRRDIQGLRAVAVGAVLLYHLWPHRLTGGYVGVDVFFVISGFLITSHLLRKPIRDVRGLLDFWARRVRRLIPAASVVLLSTLVASLVWLPGTVMAQVARETTAAALYVENWLLARSSTDYLAADQLHSPVQHYWSLSVEEQFYLVWPVLVGAAVWAAARWRRRGIPLLVIGAVVVGSLAWSVHLTATDPAPAYFVTTTRLWELAAGALLAALVAVRPIVLPGVVRAVLAWAGLGLVGWSVLTFTAQTAFPGIAALVPVAGTLLVIAASSDDVRGGPGGLLGWRPTQVVGDLSYSLYLWHWPLIVIAPFAIGHELAWVEKLVLLVVALVLSVLSKRFVEDPLRWNPLLARRLASTFLFLVLCAAVVVGGAWATGARAAADVERAEARAAEAVAAAEACLGAAATRDAGCDPQGDSLVTTPEFAATDKPDVYADGCWNSTPFTSRNVCHYGAEDPAVRVAVLGNSHGGHWMPAVQNVLEEHDDWQVTTYLQSMCYPVDLPVTLPKPEDTGTCQETNRWAIGEIEAGDYDLVMMSARTHEPLQGVAPEDKSAVAQNAYADVLDRFTAAGSNVLVMRDTPAMKENVPDCLAEHPDDWGACATDHDGAIEDDPLAAAGRADTSGSVSVADINDRLCRDGECLPVVGGVVAFFDHGHLSATFAETLTPEIRAAMEDALP
jgi:peptidoglycan/LPS O-acetylase OafA/YrhL